MPITLDPAPGTAIADETRQGEVQIVTRACEWPKSTWPGDRIAAVTSALQSALAHVYLSGVRSRREFLIVPVIAEAVVRAQVRLEIDWPIDRGSEFPESIDYVLASMPPIVVTAATPETFEDEIRRLASQLVWIDRNHGDERASRVYGAVSSGTEWRFAFLDSAAREVVLHPDIQRTPDELESVLSLLGGCLGSSNHSDIDRAT